MSEYEFCDKERGWIVMNTDLDTDYFHVSVEVEPGHDDPIRMAISTYPVELEVSMDYDDLRKLADFLQRFVIRIDGSDEEGDE